MANFSSVTLGNGTTTVSNDSPAGALSQGERAHAALNQAMSTDFATTQPKNMRITSGPNGGSVETVEVQTAGAPSISGLPGSLGTIQTGAGFPLGDLTRLNPAMDTIMVGGSRCTINTAIQQGYLHRDAAGNLAETETLKAINKPYLTPAPPAPTEVVDLVPSHRETLTQLNQRAGSTQTSAFIAQAVQASVTGKSLDHLVADFAQTVNAQPDTVHAWVNEYISDLATKGFEQAAQMGKITNPEHFMAFMETLPDSTRARLVLAVHYGDKSALQYLLQAYKADSRKPSKGKE